MTDSTITFEPPGKGEWRSLRDHFPRALTPEYARAPARRDERRRGDRHGGVRPSGPVPGRRACRRATSTSRRSRSSASPAMRMPPRGRPVGGDPTRAGVPPPHEGRGSLPRRAPVAGRRPALVRHRAEHLGGGQPGAAGRGPRRHGRAGARRSPAPSSRPRRGGLRAPLRAARSRPDADRPAPRPRRRLGHRTRAAVPGARRRVAGLDGSRPGARGAARCRRPVRARAEHPGGAPRRSPAPALDAFLAEHGWRLVTGYDIDSLALVELPSLVVNLARPTPSEPIDEDEAAAALEVLADKVGAADRDELARLVGDARATVGLRDDNGAVTAAWPAGLLRRAMLAAGRSLVDRGRPRRRRPRDRGDGRRAGRPARGHAARWTERPWRRRAEQRAARSELVPPLQLGPSADIPVDVLPAADADDVAGAASRSGRSRRPRSGARASLDGDGIGSAVVRGRALRRHGSGRCARSARAGRRARRLRHDAGLQHGPVDRGGGGRGGGRAVLARRGDRS